MNNIQFYSERVLQLVAKNQMKEAIQEAKNLFRGSPEFYELTLQSARYSDVIKSIRMGVIDFDNASVEKNKIRYALIDMLRELEESIIVNPSIQEEVNTYLKEHQATISNNATIIGDNNINIQGFTSSGINIQTGKNKEKL